MMKDKYYYGHINEKDNRLYDVFAVKLAGYLLMHKIALLEIKPIQIHEKDRKIFIFRNSPRLKKYVELYFANNGKMLKDDM